MSQTCNTRPPDVPGADEIELSGIHNSESPISTGRRNEVEQLYLTYAKPLWKLFYLKCSDPELAHDAVQESFRRLLDQREGAIHNPASWLRMVGKNYLIDRSRRFIPSPDSEATTELATILNDEPWMTCSKTEAQQHVVMALGKLSDRDRRVLWMRYAHDRTSRQIGQVFGTTPNAIDMCISRARQRLAVAMQSVSSAGQDTIARKTKVIEQLSKN